MAISKTDEDSHLFNNAKLKQVHKFRYQPDVELKIRRPGQEQVQQMEANYLQS